MQLDAWQEAALSREWNLRKARKQVKLDAKGNVMDAESRSLYLNRRRVEKPLKADREAMEAVGKRRDESLLVALENYRLCAQTLYAASVMPKLQLHPLIH